MERRSRRRELLIAFGAGVLTGPYRAFAQQPPAKVPIFNPEIAVKRLELLKATLPRIRRIAVLFNPGG